MANLGLQNAFGQEAVAQGVRQRIFDQLQQQSEKFKQGLETRAADRADRALSQQDVLTRLKIQEMADAKQANESDRQFLIAKTLNDTIPAGNVLPVGSPAIKPLQSIGALDEQTPTLPSTSTIGVQDAPTGTGAIRGQIVGQTKNPGNPLQYVKRPSQAENVATAAQGSRTQDYQRKLDEAAARAEQAWERLRMQGDTATAQAQFRQSQLELAQARLEAERAKSDAASAKTPQPQFFQDSGHNWHAVIFDKGALKEIPLPAGYTPTSKSQPLGLWDYIKNAVGAGASPSAPTAGLPAAGGGGAVEHWVRDASGKLVRQSQ